VATDKPAFSPFEQDKNRRRFDEDVVPAATVVAPSPVPARTVAEEKAPSGDNAVVRTAEVVRAEPVTKTSHAAVVKDAEELQPSGLHSEDLQRAAVKALSGAKSQDTAADALGDAEWAIESGEIRVQTELSKTMLPMVINAEAEKLIKAALRDAGAGALKLVLLPGVKSAAATKKPKAAKAGSVQAIAMEHPVVQRAQTLFNAEIQSVIDLRDND
jgi:DNA polymerase-3 subunit gamma/tau